MRDLTYRRGVVEAFCRSSKGCVNCDADRWDCVMEWTVLLVASLGLIGGVAFVWIYQRRLDELTGPWILRELSRDD